MSASAQIDLLPGTCRNPNAHVTKSSERHDYPTPWPFFRVLDAEFHFTLDVCAEPANAKCDRFFTVQENGLAQNWRHPSGFQERATPDRVVREAAGAFPASPDSQAAGGVERIWMNPPYGEDLERWMIKAHSEAKAGAGVVCLVPARTATKWFHRLTPDAEVRILRGRLRFEGMDSEAPFAQVVIIFRPQFAGVKGMFLWEWRKRSKQMLLTTETQSHGEDH